MVTSGAPLPAALVRALLNAGALAVVLPGECVPRVADLPGFFTAFYGELHRLLALPLLVDVAPSGKFLCESFHRAGGVPAVMGELLAAGLLLAGGGRVAPAARLWCSAAPPGALSARL